MMQKTPSPQSPPLWSAGRKTVGAASILSRPVAISRLIVASLAATAAVSFTSAQTSVSFTVEGIATPDGSNLRTSSVTDIFAWSVGGGADEATPASAGFTWSDSQPSQVTNFSGAVGDLTDREGTSTRGPRAGNPFDDPFQEVMDDYTYTNSGGQNSGGSFDISLSFDLDSLTIGQEYRLQLLAARDTSRNGQNRLVLGTDAVNDPNSGNYDYRSSSGPGIGALVIADFTASGTTQTVTVYGDANDDGSRGIINGLTLQAIPEPSAVAGIFGVAALGFVFCFRRQRSKA